MLSNLKIPICSLALLMLFSQTIRSQSITRSVVASAGDEYAKAGLALNWTLGEIFSETLELDGNTYAMGYQQGFVQVRQVHIHAHTSNMLPKEIITTVFPNPFSQTLTIQPSQGLGPALVSIFSITGAKVYESTLNLDDGQTIDLTSLQNGAYVLRVQSGTVQSFMILKNTK